MQAWEIYARHAHHTHTHTGKRETRSAELCGVKEVSKNGICMFVGKAGGVRFDEMWRTRGRGEEREDHHAVHGGLLHMYTLPTDLPDTQMGSEKHTR